MAAMTAKAYNPAMKDVYRRLTDAGKATEVALVAVMRKLVILANALTASGRAWSEVAPPPPSRASLAPPATPVRAAAARGRGDACGGAVAA